jgi:two-component system NtrC family sensor kinase
LRRVRYALLAAAVLGSLAVIARVAVAQFRAAAREEAKALAAGLDAALRSFHEHARLLAEQPPEYAMFHLTRFRGLCRARRFDAEGRETMHLLRVDYQVARLPSARLGRAARPPPALSPGEVAVSDFERDDGLDWIAPELRTVLRYTTPVEGGGVLELTVHVEPFLEPIRAAGAALVGADGRPRIGGAVDGEAAGAPWRVVVPVRAASSAALPLLGALALAVLALAGAAVVVSERQLRLQERAEVERRLAQGERLASLGLLAAGIAHEINNPLEGIANWIRLGRTDKAQEGLRRIETLVRDLLSFARPRDDGGGAADVRRSLDRALELARFAKAFRDVEVLCDADPGVVAAVPAPSLEQVFLNLLLNAGAAMREGARRLEVRAARANDRVRVEFRDHGPGIAPADLARVFDPFFSRTGGTGLGLSVSYGIVKAVGGELRAENAPGGGARFTVELPAR